MNADIGIRLPQKTKIILTNTYFKNVLIRQLLALIIEATVRDFRTVKNEKISVI